MSNRERIGVGWPLLVSTSLIGGDGARSSPFDRSGASLVIEPNPMIRTAAAGIPKHPGSTQLDSHPVWVDCLARSLLHSFRTLSSQRNSRCTSSEYELYSSLESIRALIRNSKQYSPNLHNLSHNQLVPIWSNQNSVLQEGYMLSSTRYQIIVTMPLIFLSAFQLLHRIKPCNCLTNTLIINTDFDFWHSF